MVFNYGECSNSRLIEKYTRVVSLTSHVTGKTTSYRVAGGDSHFRFFRFDVEDKISTDYGNGNMDCEYYEPKPPSSSWLNKIKKKIRKVFGELV